jgi:hypothetical protein
MFGWLRRTTHLPPEFHTAPVEAPTFRPAGASLLLTSEEVESSFRLERAIVYITVEWSGQERRSRSVFREFLRRLEAEHADLQVRCCVLSDESENQGAWFENLKLPGAAGTGYGAVVWLQQGQALGVTPYAAEVGVEGLMSRTLEFWGCTASAFFGERGA